LKDPYEEAGKSLVAMGHAMHIINYFTMCIMVDEWMSVTREMKYVSGVLRGETLSHLLFQVMTSSIVSQVSLHNMRLLIYADNMVLTAANPKDIQNLLTA
jgi:uncharacterized membrane protein